MSQNSSRRTESTRRAQKGLVNTVFLLIVLGVVIVANLIFNLMSVRLDLTRGQQFTLASASREVVSNLEGELTVYAFVTSDLPAQYSVLERQIRDLLADYENASNGNFVYRIIDPDAAGSGDDEGSGEGSEEAEFLTEGRALAAEYGVPPFTIIDQQQTQVSAREVFLGMAVEYQGESEDRVDVVERVYPGMNLEYELTRRMRQLVDETQELPTLGFVINDGSFLDTVLDQAAGPVDPMNPMGSPDMAALQEQLVDQLESMLFDSLFEIELVDLNEEVADDVQGLILLGPEETYSETALENLDAFIMSGRGVAIFASPYRLEQLDMGDMQIPGMQLPPVHARNEHGLDELLASYGVEIRQDAVLDNEAMQLSVIQETGTVRGRQVSQLTPFMDPRLPVISEMNAESIVAGEIPFLAFMPLDRQDPLPTSTLRVLPSAANDSNIEVTEVAATSSSSFRIHDRMSVGIDEMDSLTLESAVADAAETETEDDDDVEGPHPVIVTLEGALSSAYGDETAEQARLLVASNGTFIRNAFNQNDLLMQPMMQQMLPPDLASTVQAYQFTPVMFLKNTADWIVEDADLIAIRSRGIPTFVDVEDLRPGRRLAFQVINIAGVPAFFLVIAAIVAARRRKRREEYGRMFAGKK